MKIHSKNIGKLILLVLTMVCVLGLCACKSNTASNQGTEPEAYAFEAQYIRTNGYSEGRSYPYHVVIDSKEELEAYYEANKDFFDLERKEKVYSDTTIGFLDACDKYDDTYFERQNLVLIILEEGSGSIRHEITDVRNRWDENGASLGWNITIKSTAPEVVTDDMAEWHLFLEVQMGNIIKDGDDVWINDKLSSNGSVNKYEGPLSCISHTNVNGIVSLMDMTEEVQEVILSALNIGTWMNDMSKCESDFSFETKNEKIYYHADCGTFSDATNKRYMTLSESERTKINQLLGAEPSVVKTYEKTPSEHAFENDELCVLVKHYEMSDGTWKTDKHTYQYRLEITGRMNNAAKDSTFIYLSNVEDISFDKAWNAAGLSSNMNDYYDSEVAILVAMK